MSNTSSNRWLLCLAFALLCWGNARAAIAHVGTDSAGHTTANGTSFTVTTSQAGTNGDVLMFFIGNANASADPTYTPPANVTAVAGWGSTCKCKSFYCYITVSNCTGTSFAFTTTSSQKFEWYVAEFSGVVGGFPVGTTSAGSCSSGVTICNATITQSTANVLPVLIWHETGTDTKTADPSGFTLGASITTGPTMWGYFDNSTISGNLGNTSPTWNTTAVALEWYGLTLLPAAATSTTSNRMMMGCCH